MLRNIVWYLKKRPFFILLVGYYFVAILLYHGCSIDIFVPCLNKWLTGRNCPSCGINRSLLCLVQGKISQAYELNPLVFFILPIGFLTVLLDYAAVIRNKKSSI